MRSDKCIYKKTIDMINNDDISEEEKKKRISVVDKIIAEKDISKRYSILYDMICDYLDNEFQSNNICGFKDGICSRRQDMIDRGIKKECYLNGCCYGYKEGKTCDYLIDGHCSIKNIACKTFTCPYLRKKGYKFSINKIYFAKYFFNIAQKVYMEHTHFVDKDIVMKGIMKLK